jgi:hypothetical protein
MSIRTVITGGFGSFGSTSLVILDGYSIGEAPPVVEVIPTTVPSGGFRRGDPYRYTRRPEIKKLFEEIPPKVAQVISVVAEHQVENLRLDDHQRLEELVRELELEGLEWNTKYLNALNLQREALIDEEISERLHLLKRRREEEAIIMLILMNL